MSDFLKLKSGISINPAAISIIDLTKPDSVTIQVGASSVTAEGDDAKMLREHYGVKPDAATAPAAPAANAKK